MIARRELLASQVAGALRREILSGVRKLGEKLREGEIASRFEVSHSVVREAFHILQGEGLVEADPHRGRSVFHLTEGEAKDLLLIRTSLEALAAFLAAERLTDESKHLIIKQQEEIEKPSPPTYTDRVERELAFHRAIWKAAGDRWLFDKLDGLTVPFFAVDPTRDEEPAGGEERTVSKAFETSHRWVAGEVLSGDPERARLAMIRHLMSVPSLIERRRLVFGV
jgi:DNA-binding GntR family transcriptional regulator